MDAGPDQSLFEASGNIPGATRPLSCPLEWEEWIRPIATNLITQPIYFKCI